MPDGKSIRRIDVRSPRIRSAMLDGIERSLKAQLCVVGKTLR